MATLGSLVVSLSANTAQFTGAMDKAAYQSAKRMEDMKRQAAMAGAAIGGALVAGAAGLAVAVTAVADRADAMGKEAQKVGEGVAEFSRLTHAAEESGSSMEGLSTGLKKLNQNMAEVALTGKGPAADAFVALRISVQNADGTLKSGSAVMSEVAERFVTMQDGAQKTAFAMDIFGKAGADLIPMLNSGADGLAAMKQEADALGIVISENTYRAAEAFNDNLSRMQKIQSGIVTQITAEMLPTMLMLSDEFVEVSKNSGLVSAAASAAKTTLETLIVVGGNVAFVFRGVGTEIGGIAAQLAALGKGDFRAFSEIGKQMKADAEAARKEFDAWEQRILNPAPVDMAALEADAQKKLDIARKGAAEEARLQSEARAAEAARVAAVKAGERAAAEAQRAAQRAAEESARAIQRAADEAAKAQQRLMDEGQRITESMRTPSEALAAQLANLDKLLAAKAIESEAYGRAKVAAQEAYAAIGVAAEKAAKAEEDARIRARESLYSGLLTEEEALAMSYVKRYEQIMASTEITETERQDLLRRLREGFDAEQDGRERERISTQLQNASALFDGLAGIAASAAGKQSALYRAMFAVSKAFAVADALVKIQQGIANAVSLPWPSNIAAMASTASAATGIVSAIQGTQFDGGRALGGPVRDGRSYLVGERGPERITMAGNGHVTPTEQLVAPAPQQNIRIVNAFDSSVIGDYLGSDSGEQLIMNAVQRNATTVRQLAGGGR